MPSSHRWRLVQVPFSYCRLCDYGAISVAHNAEDRAKACLFLTLRGVGMKVCAELHVISAKLLEDDSGATKVLVSIESANDISDYRYGAIGCGRRRSEAIFG